MLQAIQQLDRAMYIKELFDPIQTHAVYRVDSDLVNQVKYILKVAGATRFRIVKVRNSNLRIVCFKKAKK